jgi:hypothetical protein
MRLAVIKRAVPASLHQRDTRRVLVLGRAARVDERLHHQKVMM